ncbi:MAG: PEP-CTERM sorting domain-containing protein [Nitrospiraceae bacterium]
MVKTKMRNGKAVIRLLTLIVGLALALPVQAIPILPGGSGRPPGTNDFVLGDVLAANSVPFSGRDALGAVLFTGTLDTAVVVEAGSQTLNFLYGITNNANSTDGIPRMSVTNFAGFTTDIGWIDDGSGALGVDSVTRQPSGGTISFNFENFIRPGQETSLLFIKTNATDFHRGSATLINGGVAALNAFAPLGTPVAAPEPASLLLLGSGLAGWVVWGRLRQRPT